jgi:hypothetical protein
MTKTWTLDAVALTVAGRRAGIEDAVCSSR